MKIIKSKKFANGIVYALELRDGRLIEVTDTFLPYYTKGCINQHSNKLRDDQKLRPNQLGSRGERWMIGVSVMSGCPVGCKFCATGQMESWRNLTAEEILEQVMFVVRMNSEYHPVAAQEFKINYTRMGEPMLNAKAVQDAVREVEARYAHTHHYVSTIGIKGMDTAWVKNNITLQVSLHSLDEARRDELIPFTQKMSIEELGAIRTESDLKTTINMTLVDEEDFDIEVLKKHFDPEHFFIKLSPINENKTSVLNNCGAGIIQERNLQ